MHPRYMSKVITVESEPTNDYVMCGGSGGLSGDVCERAFVSDSVVCVCMHMHIHIRLCLCVYIWHYAHMCVYMYVHVQVTVSV